MVNYEELAEMLSGGECRNEVTDEIRKLAKESGIVIVYGASDDLMELDGAIYDEFGCYEGGTAYLNGAGLFEESCGCKYESRAKDDCKTIEAVWCGKDTEFTWTYKTDIPHATFEIYDDGEKYCLGICFNINSL